MENTKFTNDAYPGVVFGVISRTNKFITVQMLEVERPDEFQWQGMEGSTDPKDFAQNYRPIEVCKPANVMKKQSEIKLTDIFPNADNVRRPFHAPYRKQEELIFREQSISMKCPCCNEQHTMNELIVNHPDYRKKDASDITNEIECPGTKEPLILQQTLVAGQYWLERKSNETITTK